MTNSDKELDEILGKLWLKGVSAGQRGEHPGGKPATEAKQRLNALIEKKVREAKEYHLDTLKRTENVAEALSDEDWRYLGSRKRELEAELQDNQAKEGV